MSLTDAFIILLLLSFALETAAAGLASVVEEYGPSRWNKDDKETRERRRRAHHFVFASALALSLCFFSPLRVPG